MVSSLIQIWCEQKVAHPFTDCSFLTWSNCGCEWSDLDSQFFQSLLKVTIIHTCSHTIIYSVTTLQTMWSSLTIPWWFIALLRSTSHVKCYSYHACTSTKYMCGRKYAAYNKHFRQLFPDKIFSLTFPWLLVKYVTFPWQLSNSPTFPGFPDKWSPCI